MSDDQDMSEFEKQVEDIIDPHPLQFHEYDEERGTRIAALVSELANLVVDDLVMAMNLKKPALCQYLYGDGTTVTAILTNPKTMVLTIQHAGDHQWIKWQAKDEG